MIKIQEIMYDNILLFLEFFFCLHLKYTFKKCNPKLVKGLKDYFS